jgi:hypothetical protein
MSTLKKTLPLQPAAPPPAAGEVVRHLAAGVLATLSTALARVAAALDPMPPGRTARAPRVEYHADVGAPEGALYVDGELVGWLRGVRRL